MHAYAKGPLRSVLPPYPPFATLPLIVIVTTSYVIVIRSKTHTCGESTSYDSPTFATVFTRTDSHSHDVWDLTLNYTLGLR